jgi:drug/metabolite transporter (DMT)-like permease
MPLMAMVWGIADGETVGWAQLIGMGLILSGVYLTRK